MKGSLVMLACALVAIVNCCTNNGPLGMISGEIADWQISASSAYPTEWEPACQTRAARPYAENKLGWCARYKTTSEWLQIDLGVLTMVTGLITQGRADGKEWVTKYKLSYSPDGMLWDYVTDENRLPRIFEGNTDSYSIQHVYLPQPFEARFIKLHVEGWNRHPSMRVELVGCQDSKQNLGQPPYGSLKASSAHNYRRGSSCQSQDGHVMSNKAWCAATSDDNQWLQLDIGPPSLVTAVVTKGRGDTGRQQWVTQYRVSYSNDSINWTFYSDEHDISNKYLSAVDSEAFKDNKAWILHPNKVAADGVMEFGGNGDKHTSRVHFLSKPFRARYIRFHPLSWENGIAMRVGVLGRPYQGDCTPGFTRPNLASPCVENLAYQKETWLNKDRHNKRALDGSPVLVDVNQELAQKAVDGITIDDIHSCTILDNYYDEQPQLTIDLGSRYDVSGIVIYMWHGGDEEMSAYNKDYALNLDGLSVFISSGKTEEELCGQVSNTNHELILHREHRLTCEKRINGRYIRIQPDGRPQRFNNWYSAVICEVMAFS